MARRDTRHDAGPDATARARTLLDRALAWRRGGMLLGLYKQLPESLRTFTSRLAWRRLWVGVKFPPLPTMPAPPVRAPLREVERLARVNLFGFFGGQFGLGESARLYASALDAAGIPVAIVDVDLGLPHARQAVAQGAKPNTDASAVDLVVVNPDYIDRALPLIESIGPARRFRIACWYWELGQVPQHWRESITGVDAIMTSSRFVEQAFSSVTDKPVFHVPLPLAQQADSGLGRESFGLSMTAFVFLASFDFHSSVHRKNPHDTIRAFRQAFPRGDEAVQLVVKSSNGEYYPEQLAALIEAAAGDSRILIRDQVIDAMHMRSLQRCCDAYVSLHRAEGFGLGLAECMAMGKPVVATAWSGNVDFMDADNSCLVEAVPVPVNPHEYPNAERGAVWAQPDVAQAAQWMRRLFADRGLATRIGERAAQHVREQLAPQRVAELFVTQVKALLRANGAAAYEFLAPERVA